MNQIIAFFSVKLHFGAAINAERMLRYGENNTKK